MDAFAGAWSDVTEVIGKLTKSTGTSLPSLYNEYRRIL